jgi:hypothetical protein
MKKQVVYFFFCLLIPLLGISQKQAKIYYNHNWQVVGHPSEAAYYRTLTLDRHKRPIGLVRAFYLNGELEWDGKMTYLDPNDGNKYTPEGLCRWFYPNGLPSMEATFRNGLYDGVVTTWYKNRQKAKEIEYSMGKPNGKWIEYHENGTILRKALYKNGKNQEKWSTECDELARCQKVFLEEFKSAEASTADWPVLHHTESDKQYYKIEFQEGKGLAMENENNRDLAQWIHLPIETKYNFSLETTARFVHGDLNSGYGLMWGFKDWNNYYYFILNAQGYYKTGVVSEGIHHVFSTWKHSPYTHQGISSNLLKINKIKDKLYFSINRQVVEKLDFHDFTVPTIGLISTGGSKKILFEQLLARQDLFENQTNPIELAFPSPPLNEIIPSRLSESTGNQTEVEREIPIGKTRENAIGIILGIEEYKNTGKVSFAHRDAETIKQYFLLTLGIPSDHLYYKTDQNVTKGEFHKLFGRGGWLDKRCDSTTEVFIYFVGHGAPTDDGKTYLMPYDGDPNYLSLSGYSLDAFFQDLGMLPAKQVIVMMDACFSGLDRETHQLLTEARSIGIRTKEASSPERVSLFSAAGSNQSSISWPEKSHGLFTYFLLKGLQGGADKNLDKKITVAELGNYVKERVNKQAGFLDREQTPQVKSQHQDFVITELF